MTYSYFNGSSHHTWGLVLSLRHKVIDLRLGQRQLLVYFGI